MRYRIGRALRLIIALVLLVLLIPFLMSKLDSSSNRTIDEGVRIDKKDSNVPNKLKANDLQPIMSDSLGNYEPKNLPAQSGPGEGGKMNIHYNDI
jgi:hypothetical protein